MEKYIKVLLMLVFTFSVSNAESSSYLYKVIGKSEERDLYKAVAHDGTPVLLKMSCDGFMVPSVYATYEVRDQKGFLFRKTQVYDNATECKLAERVLSKTTPDLPIFIVKAVMEWNIRPTCTVKLEGVLSVILKQSRFHSSIEDWSDYIKSYVVEKSQQRIIDMGKECL